MGLPYSWDAVGCGHVPTLNDFHVVGIRVLEVLADEPKVVRSAAIFGSLPRGDLNRRSDVDALIVAHNGKHERATEIVASLRRFAWEEHHVLLSPHIVTSRDAWQARHNFGPSFKRTMARFEDDWTVGRPMAECFRFPYDPLARTLEQRIQKEMVSKTQTRLRSTHGFRTSFERARDSVVELNHWLRRVRTREGRRPLRLHLVLGRWLLWWQQGDLAADGKREVYAGVLRESRFEPLHEHYSELVALDAAYGELLDQAVEGRCTRAEYLSSVEVLLRRDFEVSLKLLAAAIALMTRRRPPLRAPHPIKLSPRLVA